MRTASSCEKPVCVSAQDTALAAAKIIMMAPDSDAVSFRTSYMRRQSVQR